ncbi:MAG TPA: hypothetical protein PK874_14905 [Desulfobacteraceae bacterium]|jgi:hypothetical protein|nr:MAG: hypothetical protein BWX55_00250 [Deltaproteobacteria bacterium ADurb.Bin022]HOP48940.1 hypothetical protein [Desulfobacteraceae bacterium]
MQIHISPYTEKSKGSVKQSISKLLDSHNTEREARDAFSYHFQDARSFAFQRYYNETVANREGFLSTPDFFRRFKQQYALQGIDGSYLDRLESEKETILHLIDNDELADIYFRYFAEAPLQHGDKIVRKNLGSFFSKLIHTFVPNKYCALDNPIKKYFGLGSESFFIAFIILSKSYSEWASDNLSLMQKIRKEINCNNTGKQYSAKMTDLKLLDLIFWYQANAVM